MVQNAPAPPETWLTVIMAFHWVSFRRNSKEKKNLIGLDLSHKDDSAQWKKRLASPGRSEYTIEFKHTGIFFY